MKCNGVLGVNQSKKDAEIVLRSSIFTYCQHCFFGNWCSSLDLDLNVVNTETRNDNGTLHFFDDCDNDCSIFKCQKCNVKTCNSCFGECIHCIHYGMKELQLFQQCMNVNPDDVF